MASLLDLLASDPSVRSRLMAAGRIGGGGGGGAQPSGFSDATGQAAPAVFGQAAAAPVTAGNVMSDQPVWSGDPLQGVIDKTTRDYTEGSALADAAAAQQAGYGDDVARWKAEGGSRPGYENPTQVRIPSPFTYEDPTITGKFSIAGPDVPDARGETYRGLLQQAMQRAQQPGYQPGNYRLMDRAPLYGPGGLTNTQAYNFGLSRDIDPRAQGVPMATRGSQVINPMFAGREYGYGNPFGYSETMAIGSGGAGYPISVSPQFGGNTPRVYGWPGQVGNWGGAGAAYY